MTIRKFTDSITYTKIGNSGNNSATLSVDTNDRLTTDIPNSLTTGSSQIPTQGYVDRGLGGATLISVTSDADIILTPDQVRAKTLIIIDQGHILTTDRFVIYPDSLLIPNQRILAFTFVNLRAKTASDSSTVLIQPLWIKEMVNHNGSIDDFNPTPVQSIGKSSYNFTADADTGVGIREISGHCLYITDNGNVLTTQRELSVTPGYFSMGEIPFQWVENLTLHPIRYCKTSGAGIVIPSGEGRFIRYDIFAGPDIKEVPVQITSIAGLTLSSPVAGDVLMRKASGWINAPHTKIYETQFPTTTNASTVATFDGSSVSIPVGKAATFEVSISGIRTGGAGAGTLGDSSCAIVRGGIKNISGTTSLIGVNNTFANYDDGTWTTSVVANNTSDTLDVTVVGNTNVNITWTVTVRLTIS